MTKKAFPGLFLCVLSIAFLLRGILLDLRPMHHDEANQAYKFGELLEKGKYRYDPVDHHGPSLYYLTLPVTKAAGVKTYADLDETLLRLVPALFGTGIMLLLLLMRSGLSGTGVLFGGLLIALSPAMTFYSRFYIQETLLVFFLAGLIAAGWNFLQTRSHAWAGAAGLFAGMMYATKETSLVLFGAAGSALLIGYFLDRKPGRPEKGRRESRPGKTIMSIGFFAAGGAVPAWLLFTSFLKYPAGLRESVMAFGAYWSRAGESGIHTHPWFSYLQTLAFSRFGNGPVWSEAFVLILAVVGGIASFSPGRTGAMDGRPHNPKLARFILFFSVVAGAVYSAIPYKTPWNLLPFYFGILLLAGYGTAALWRAGHSPARKAALVAVFTLGFASLGYQTYRANFVDYANPSNPYVYAQTSRDFLRLVDSVQSITEVSLDGRNLLIKVIAPPEQTWPLPWYFRKFKRVGYWTAVDDAEALTETPVIISSAAYADEIDSRLGDGFQSAFYGLRPEVVLMLSIRRDLWNEFVKSRKGRTPGG